MKQYDIIILGGGPAGLTAALHLSQNNIEVLVIEKQTYPHHKVCGEYLSNEIRPYLDSLGVCLPNPVEINNLLISTIKGTFLKTMLPLGGLGISRFALDNTLYLKALEQGASFSFETVKEISFNAGTFEVITASEMKYKARIVIGAYGKRSSLDKKLQCDFIKKKSPWLGVKGHYSHDDFPDDLVALHNFEGGYAGLSKTETGAINFCYLVNYKSFERYKDIDHFNKFVVAKNPFLSQFLRSATPLFNTPLSIAQVSFHRKQTVAQHVLMCGDTAGLIHPLCGNGMAMAIHSAKMVSELILTGLNARSFNRPELERAYQRKWHATFSKRLSTGRLLQAALLQPILAHTLMKIIIRSPSLLKRLIEQTHGQPLEN